MRTMMAATWTIALHLGVSVLFFSTTTTTTTTTTAFINNASPLVRVVNPNHRTGNANANTNTNKDGVKAKVSLDDGRFVSTTASSPRQDATTSTTTSGSQDDTISIVHVTLGRSLPVDAVEASQAWMNQNANQHRTWLPFLIQQEHDRREEKCTEFRSRITDFRLLKSVITSSSSDGDDDAISLVRFLPDDSTLDSSDSDSSSSRTCRMTWEVKFQVRRYPKVAHFVTARMMHAAADHLQGTVSTPRVLSRRQRLRGVSISSKEQALDAWMQFVWSDGGGLPLFIPPLLIGGKEDKKLQRLILPPGLSESVVSVNRGAARCEVHYVANNPGIWTYPIYTHHGRVRFEDPTTTTSGDDDDDDDDGVDMLWEVEIRPFRGGGGALQFLAEKFTEATITTTSRNFAVHLAEPEAVVKVAQPRGKGKSFASVRKDTWLGGVLDSHLSDNRSTMEQTIAMFQPWTWGRSTDKQGTNASTEWTDGYLSS
jgi:hypothetical protein